MCIRDSERRAVFEGLKERLHDDQIRQVEIRSEMDRLRERILQEFEIDLEVEAPKRLASLEGGDSSVPAQAAVEGAPAAAPAADLEIEVEGEGESEGEGEGEAEGKAEGEGEGERGGEPAVRGPLDPEAARVQIEELRRKLADIGPVNFLASEEYDRQRERLLFHRKQQEDLRKARTDLLQAIAQINETAGRMFLETFETARQNFRATFEFLFPGGEADVALAGEDPLECGIDITARPRGKKLEAIRLLSTGERSLTAIALLFGLYLVKPSPFCMLDELDAPLDDANIGRFVTLLGHHRERTQFIVITHNKRTMEAADRLYGVTMQEPGISKIVSVRLSDVEAEILPVTAGAGGGVEGGTAGPDADAGAGGPERGQP
ncbi:MAG: hypothetical protein QUU85_16405, partial [Candidatus Eisenbacteria bacterium]|nr:hypothetical protein [Candidatus Eisenbacteria bacterium]